MNPTSDRPRYVERLRFAALVAFSIAVGAAMRSKPMNAAFWLELGGCGVLFALIWFCTPVGRAFQRASSTVRAFCAVVMATLLVGQAADNNRRYFPLMSWNMYTHVEAQTARVRIPRIVVVRPDGTRTFVHEDTVLVGLEKGIGEHLGWVVAEAQRSGDLDPAGPTGRRIDQMLRAIAGRHKHYFPDIAANSIELVFVTTVANWDALEFTETHETAWTVSLVGEAQR